MENSDRKNNAAHGATIEDLQRVVRARKYRFCVAEYSQLAEGANIMPEVRDRYLKIAQYYRELAQSEEAGSGETESTASAAPGAAAQDQPRSSVAKLPRPPRNGISA